MAINRTSGAKLYIGGTGAIGSESAWVEIGEVENYGEFGRVYNLVTFDSIGEERTQKLKGGYNEGALNLQLGRDPANDAGQEDMQAALTSRDSYNFKIELNDDPDDGSGSAPTTFTFKGLVMSFTANLGTRDQVIMSAATVEINSDITETAAISVA